MSARSSHRVLKRLVAGMPAGSLAWTRGMTTAVAAAVLLLAMSCDECTSPSDCPPEALGTVQGNLLGGGQPAVSNVELIPVEPVTEGDAFITRSDSTGWYSLTVPCGRYLMRFAYDCYYGSSGLVEDGHLADTLVVAGSTLRIDVAGGAARLRLNVPTVLRTHRIWVRLGLLGGNQRIGGWIGSPSDTGVVRETRFPFLQDGAYVVYLEFDHGPGLWLPLTLDPASAGTFQVGTDSTVTLTVTLPEPGWISGEISGSHLRFGNLRPCIQVFNADSTLLHEERLYSSSEYRLILPLTVPVKLAVEISGRALWIGGYDFSSAALLVPEPGEELTGVDLVESGIACVLEGPGSNTRYDMDCGLYYADGTRLPGWSSYIDNPVFFSNLRPGTYFLHFQRARWDQVWYSQWYDGAESLGAATPITITTAGEVVEITAHLREGGRITGHVTRAGLPAPAVWIGIHRTDGALSEGRVTLTSSRDGTFALVGLNDGNYHVGARNPSNIATYWYPGTYDAAQATAIHIENHEAVAGIGWEIPF